MKALLIISGVLTGAVLGWIALGRPTALYVQTTGARDSQTYSCPEWGAWVYDSEGLSPDGRG